MSIHFNPENSTPTFTETDFRRYEDLYSLLKFVDTNDRIIYAKLPNDSVVYPGSVVSVMPYKMDSSFSHYEEGVWQVKISDDKNEKTLRIQATPCSEGAFCQITVADKIEEKGFRDASTAEISDLACVLETIKDGLEKDEEVLNLVTRKRNASSGFIGKLLRRT